jgi:hypothetical protein
VIRVVKGNPAIGPKRKRPKLCAVCQQPASFVEQVVEPALSLTREGVFTPFDRVINEFFCKEHTGIEPHQR